MNRAFCCSIIAALLVALPSIGDAQLIGSLAASNPDLSTLAAAITAAGLADELNDASAPLTVFAPTNAAFETLLAQLGLTAEALLSDTPTLTSVLLYHVVPGEVPSTILQDGEKLTTLLPQGMLTVAKNDTGVFISPTGGATATVVMADVEAVNGVVHIIDTVLLPGMVEGPASEAAMVQAPAAEAVF